MLRDPVVRDQNHVHSSSLRVGRYWTELGLLLSIVPWHILQPNEGHMDSCHREKLGHQPYLADGHKSKSSHSLEKAYTRITLQVQGTLKVVVSPHVGLRGH